MVADASSAIDPDGESAGRYTSSSILGQPSTRSMPQRVNGSHKSRLVDVQNSASTALGLFEIFL